MSAHKKRFAPSVLFVNRMASMVRGGGETFDLEMARQLRTLGCNVTVLSGIPLFGREQTPIEDLPSSIIRTPYSGWFPWDRVKGGWRLRLADFYLFERRAAAWAWKHRNEFDVVQVCELPTFVKEWKRRKGGAPVVMRLTAPDYFDKDCAFAMADGCIASGATLQAMRSGPCKSCVDIPNGVDVQRFRPHESTFRRDQAIAADAFVILFVARFQNVKNHEMLLHAFRAVHESIPHAHLVLAGSGPLEARSKDLAERMGVGEHVRFLGEVSYADLPRVYAAADVKVIASWYESFCFAALEGMASGLPLVVTDTQWVPTLIERTRGGMVVPVNDAEAMARALIDIAQDPPRRKSMGAFNRQKVESTYQWKGSAVKLLDLYKRLLGSCQPENVAGPP